MGLEVKIESAYQLGTLRVVIRVYAVSECDFRIILSGAMDDLLAQRLQDSITRAYHKARPKAPRLYRVVADVLLNYSRSFDLSLVDLGGRTWTLASTRPAAPPLWGGIPQEPTTSRFDRDDPIDQDPFQI